MNKSNEQNTITKDGIISGEWLDPVDVKFIRIPCFIHPDKIKKVFVEQGDKQICFIVIELKK